MTAARKYVPHYTVNDYASWEGEWELWSGIPVSMSPSPFGSHQSAAINLAFALKLSIRDSGCGAAVLNEMDWIVSSDTIVRPDVVLLCDGVPTRHIESPPALVAEVISESTETRDRTYKRDLYDEQGVGVYLLLDPEAKTLEAYQRDAAGKWQHQQVTESIELCVCETCEIHLERSTLFTS